MRKGLILFVDLFKTGGIQTYNRYLCDSLESEFSDRKFVAISLYDPQKSKLKEWRNIEMRFCDAGNLKFIRKALFIFKIISVLITEKPRFLICAHVDLSPIGLIFKRIFGLKYAILTHGIDVWNLNAGIKYKGLKSADLITAVSQYTKDRIIANGICESEIKLLHDTIEPSLFYKKDRDPALLRELKLENKRILLTVGRISSKERYKGYDVMLKVLDRLEGECVWLVAGEGDDLSYLEQMAKDLGVFEKVRFLGFVENAKLVDYYNLCNVFIMPSKGEGFGIVFLEAMACGKPVIGGNRDGSAEPLMSGRLGFMVDPDNADEIIETINFVLKSKEDRTDAEYLRKQVEINFGIKQFNKKVKEIFWEMIK